jgi:hypothetical protein
MHDHSLALATATSGMIGGVTRAVAEEMTLSTISLQGFLDVVFYATVSASVGYGVKQLWDRLVARWKALEEPVQTPRVRSTLKPVEWSTRSPRLPEVKEPQVQETAAEPPLAAPKKRRPNRSRGTSQSSNSRATDSKS